MVCLCSTARRSCPTGSDARAAVQSTCSHDGPGKLRPLLLQARLRAARLHGAGCLPRPSGTRPLGVGRACRLELRAMRRRRARFLRCARHRAAGRVRAFARRDGRSGVRGAPPRSPWRARCCPRRWPASTVSRLVEDMRRVGGDDVAAVVARVYGGDSESVTREEWAPCWKLFGPWVIGDEERARTVVNSILNAPGLTLMRGFDVRDRLAGVTCPTLICAGELDSDDDGGRSPGDRRRTARRTWPVRGDRGRRPLHVEGRS